MCWLAATSDSVCSSPPGQRISRSTRSSTGKSKMQCGGLLAEIGITASYRAPDRQLAAVGCRAVGGDHLSTDRVTVDTVLWIALELDRQPSVARSWRVVAEQSSRAVEGADREIEIAVAVEVKERCSPGVIAFESETRSYGRELELPILAEEPVGLAAVVFRVQLLWGSRDGGAAA